MKMRFPMRFPVLCITGLLPLLAAAADAPPAPPHRLALSLAAEGDAAGAALEYRRLALATPPPDPGRAGWHVAAAVSYLDAGSPERAERQLDEAETAGLEADAPLLTLRAHTSEAQRQPTTALYFWQAAMEGADPEARRFAARHVATLKLRQGDGDGALRALDALGDSEKTAREAVDRWMNASRRSPAIGGWLGLIPGLGYAYSGEYANATRSAILNGLFIWIMARCAQDDEWGVFALAAFFEFTWYSGSIYGGVDAAHRYNRRLDEQAEREILGDADMQLDTVQLPLIRFTYRF